MVPENSPLAPDRLGDQKTGGPVQMEGGRVKLDKFQIRQGCTRQEGQGQHHRRWPRRDWWYRI